MRNCGHEMPNAPAARTKTLNGVGGGSNDGTMMANNPYFLYHRRTRRTRSSENLRRKTASPPFRPTEYKSAQPKSEPTVVRSANNGMLDGLSIENVINKISLTSGSDRNDESNIARIIRPNPPYGSNVAFSHAEIDSINGIRFYPADKRSLGVASGPRALSIKHRET